MVATADIRFKRMKREYDTLHDTQDETLSKVDSLESAILGLTEAVASNRDLIMANTRQIAELHDKLDAIMKHQDVPFKPMGFLIEDKKP